jgi:hypothetical protein
VYGEDKNILYWAELEQPRQKKNLLYQHNKPNEPNKEGPNSFVLFESPFTFVSNSQQGPHSLVSLVKTEKTPLNADESIMTHD